MSKRILIVGGVAGGASAAARIRRLDEDAEIIIFEKGPHVSFSNCSLPFYLSGMVKSSDRLVLMTPEKFKKQYHIQVRTGNEVIRINRVQKTICVKNLLTAEEYEESYDKLVLSPGARPILPESIEGIASEHGFIGVETAENLRLAGKNVALIEALDQIMAPFDYDMAQILHKEMTDKGIRLILKDGVKRIGADSIELQSGLSVPAKAVIMAIGVAPETTLAKEAGIKIGATGGIKVDHNYLTNDPDIYAVGDAIEVYNRLTNSPSRLALAGPALRQARAAADHIYGTPHNHNGVIGSSVVQVFDLKAASTGLNEKTAKKAGIPYDFVYILPADKVGLMPGSSVMHFKLLFEYPTGRILGAQAIGKGNVDKRVDVIAAMITMGGTLENLKELELCYAPLFGTAKDVVNFAAMVGLNLLYGKFRQVPVTRVRELVESKACIIDVREKPEFDAGHLITAKNIPLSELRERMDEIPKDVPVYLHCRSSQRSYNAVMALQHKGYDNVYNISGSYLGICCYEYYNDLVSKRDRIVTEYNFR